MAGAEDIVESVVAATVGRGVNRQSMMISLVVDDQTELRK
jgi:hypothetical protein